VPFVFVPASVARERIAVSALVLGLVSTSTISLCEVDLSCGRVDDLILVRLDETLA
jgi:hypothetical protein